MSLFQQVLYHAKEIKTVQSILELLSWDQETLLPPNGHDHRTEQKVLISELIHNKIHDPSFFTNLTTLSSSNDHSADEDVIIKLLLKDTFKARKLPISFVQEYTRATSEGVTIWQKARSNNEWMLFQPHLEKIVQLSREKTDLLGYNNEPYDALLDEFDPEITTKEIDPFFSNLKIELKNLLEEIKKTAFFSTEYSALSVSKKEQMDVCKDLISFIGFNWNSGRLDSSTHPFSSGFHPTDTRITIRHDSNDLLDQIMAALHEAGHGFYEMGLSPKQYGNPFGEAASCSIHESQSRLWETVIGRSKEFTPHIFSFLSKAFPNSQVYANEKDLHTNLNLVQCSPIRIEADEVTYPLHIIIRYEIERALINGSLLVKEVPEKWNALTKELLDISVTSDREGCLQDVHWSAGLFGYFPSYTLGSLYSICWYKAMTQTIPNLQEEIKHGQFDSIHHWLNDNVWKYGRKFLSEQLVTKALGRKPNQEDYISYLRLKYVG